MATTSKLCVTTPSESQRARPPCSRSAERQMWRGSRHPTVQLSRARSERPVLPKPQRFHARRRFARHHARGRTSTVQTHHFCSPSCPEAFSNWVVNLQTGHMTNAPANWQQGVTLWSVAYREIPKCEFYYDDITKDSPVKGCPGGTDIDKTRASPSVAT